MAEKRSKFAALCLLELTVLLLEFQAASALTDRLPRHALKWYDQTVQFKDLAGALMDSPSKSGNNYRALIFNTDLSQLYVGGKEKLNIVDPSDMKITKELVIKADEAAASICKARNSTAQDTCYNYVRIIQPFDGDNVFACGTNAKQPKCYFVNSTSLVYTEALPAFSADNNVPAEPDQSTSWVYLPAVSKLLRAVGTEASKTGSNYNIHLSNLNGTTNDGKDVDADNNQEWLSSPEFVGDPFEYRGHIYAFFREFAVEHINGGRIIYSRVGRVCENDNGGDRFTDLQQEFTTYQKARLDCSLRENELDFNYNYLQDVYRSNQTIFAVFTTHQRVGMVSSAVCAYSLEEIAQLFNRGQLSGQAANGELWTIPATRPVGLFQCDALPVPFSPASYDFIQTYPLMNLAVSNKLNYSDQSTNDYLRESDAPLFLIDDVRLTQIVVDQNVNGVDVYFLGTEHGTIIKSFLKEENKSNAYLIEEIDLNDNQLVPQAPILTMLKDATHIFVSTDNNVYKVPLQSNCSATVNKCKCCCGLDPYCTMDTNGVCVPSTGYRGAVMEPCSLPECNCSSPVYVPVVAGPIAVVRRAPCRNTTKTPRLEDVCETIVPKHIFPQVNLNFAAHAPEGSNLRSSMVMCDCGDTDPVTKISHSICSGKEFVTVNAILNVASDCTCRMNFTSDTNSTVPLVTKITADRSDTVSQKTCMTEADDFDVKIKEYKRNLKTWKYQKIEESCPTDTNCAETCSQP